MDFFTAILLCSVGYDCTVVTASLSLAGCYSDLSCPGECSGFGISLVGNAGLVILSSLPMLSTACVNSQGFISILQLYKEACLEVPWGLFIYNPRKAVTGSFGGDSRIGNKT